MYYVAKPAFPFPEVDLSAFNRTLFAWLYGVFVLLGGTALSTAILAVHSLTVAQWRYEASLIFVLVFLYVCARGCMQWTVWTGPDKYLSLYRLLLGKPQCVCWSELMKDRLGKPQCFQQQYCHGATCKLNKQGAQGGMGQEGENHNEEKKVQVERENSTRTGNLPW